MSAEHLKEHQAVFLGGIALMVVGTAEDRGSVSRDEKDLREAYLKAKRA